MDEEFESLVVTDPELVDPGIDISGLRTQTDVSPYLLGNIPDYAGIQYEAFNPKRLSELMRLFGPGLPAIDTSQPAPPDTGGGGGDSGGGGQATLPGFESQIPEPINTPEEQRLIDEGIGVQIGLGDPVVAPGEMPVTQEEMDAFNQIPVTPVGGQPIDPTGMLPQIPEVVAQDPTTMIPQLGSQTPTYADSGDQSLLDLAGGEAGGADGVGIIDDTPGMLGDTGGSMDQMSGVQQPQTNNLSNLNRLTDYDDLDLIGAEQETPQVVDVAAAEAAIARAREAEQALLDSQSQPFTGEPQAVKTILGPDGITYDAITGLPVSDDPIMDPNLMAIRQQQNVVTETDVDVEGNLLQSGIDKIKKLLPEDFDLNSALIKTAINASIGKPVTLFLDILKSILPEQDPKQTALNEFYTTGAGAQYMNPSSPNYIPGMENYNIVSGGLLNTITGGAAGDPTTYGLQEAYQSRINTIENTLQDKYGLSAQDIADIKAGTFDPEKMDVQTDLIKRLVDLENAKAGEFAMLDELTDELGDVQQNLTPEDKKADIKIGDAATAEEIAKQDPTTEAKLKQAEQIQEIKFQEVAQNDNEKQQQQKETGVAKISENLYETKSGDVYGSAAEAAEKSDGPSSPGGKIVCTMMNESYGFGSFRNKIWMKFHKDLSPEYQKGYHKLFLPLVRIAKKNIIVRKVLEHIAVHSTIDMRQSMRGKTHLLGRVYRKILLPLCYWVGKNG